MQKKQPLLHSQAQYYSKYIRNRNLPGGGDYSSTQDFNSLPKTLLNKTSGETLPEASIIGGNSRNRVTQSIEFPGAAASRARRKPFVPLKDLLQRNHDDRVKDYLDRMKGLSIDEIVNSAALNSKAASQSASKEDIKT